MKIIHIYGHTYGGNFVVTQLKELKKQGHDLLVICTGEGSFSNQVINLGIKVVFIDFQGSRINDVFKIVKSIFTIRKVIRNYSPDVVHYHLIKAILVSRLSLFFSGVKVKVSELGGPLTLETKVFKFLDLSTSWVDTDVICSSEKIKEIYSNYFWIKSKCSLLHYAFPTSPFTNCNKMNSRALIRERYGLGSDTFLVGMVAHMYKSNLKQFNTIGIKGHEVLLSAISKVKLDSKNIHFLIAGQDIDGGIEYLNELKALAESLELQDLVTFTGHVQDVPEVIASLDLAVVPSLSENCGGAVEPLLMGVPVIASNVGGLPDVVIPDRTGWLVTAKSEFELANAINYACNLTKEELGSLGEHGRELVLSLFEPEKNADKLLKIYSNRLKK